MIAIHIPQLWTWGLKAPIAAHVSVERIFSSCDGRKLKSSLTLDEHHLGRLADSWLLRLGQDVVIAYHHLQHDLHICYKP